MPTTPANAAASPYKPLWFIFGVIVLLAAITSVSKLFRPREVVPWRTDFAAATAEAAQSGKPRLAYFTADWCGPCQSLKHTTWADKDVEAALRDYVPVKVDVAQNEAVARQYEITYIPAFVVLDADGNVVKFDTGGKTPQQFLEWLKS